MLTPWARNQLPFSDRLVHFVQLLPEDVVCREYVWVRLDLRLLHAPLAKTFGIFYSLYIFYIILYISVHD